MINIEVTEDELKILTWITGNLPNSFVHQFGDIPNADRLYDELYEHSYLNGINIITDVQVNSSALISILKYINDTVHNIND